MLMGGRGLSLITEDLMSEVRGEGTERGSLMSGECCDACRCI
jgi:hypothetical protein